MKNIFDYKDYFQTGLWHVHTNYVHGDSSVDELCEHAIKNKYPLICFSEHISKDPTYNPDSYLSDIFKAEKKYKDKLIVLSGFEVKILEDGTLNSYSNILRNSDIVFMAEHGFRGQGKRDYFKYIKSLKRNIRNPLVQVWAHPYLIPYKKTWFIGKDVKDALAYECMFNNVVVECNVGYSFLKTFTDFSTCMTLNGSDLHKIQKTI